MEEGSKVHEEDIKEKKNSHVCDDDTTEHTESDNVEILHEQSEEEFVDLLNLSLSFDEDSSTSEEYDVSTVPSCQDILGHDGITEYLDHSIQSVQSCLFCGKDTDRKFANMTYFCKD